MYSFDLTSYWDNVHLILCRLTEHEACEKLYREIMEQLTVRSREQKTSQAYARLSSAIRLRMKQYSSEVQQLKDKLSEASASHAMYPYT
jgi:DNA-binding SARP family transcriptional activator